MILISKPSISEPLENKISQTTLKGLSEKHAVSSGTLSKTDIFIDISIGEDLKETIGFVAVTKYFKSFEFSIKIDLRPIAWLKGNSY